MSSTSDDDMTSCLIGDMVNVYVGPKSKRYSVHKALLTHHQWFSKRLGLRPRPFTDYLSLLAEDPKVFELLISWLYRKSVKAICTTDDGDEEVAKEEATLYINTYLRDCEWEMHELQNALMNRVRDRRTCEYGYFPRSLIKKIYESTKPMSPLRSYIVDSFISKGVKWNEHDSLVDPINPKYALTRKRALKTQLDAGNQEFVLDCYEALFQLCAKSKIRDPDCKTGCVYHTHKEGEKCVR